MDGMINAEDLVITETTALSTESIPRATTAARTIKNAIVGNPTQKLLYLQHGVVRRLIACANLAQTEPLLAEHSVSALGSLAWYLPPADVASVTTTLLSCLFSSHVRPVYAAARALKLLVRTPKPQPPLSSTLSELIVVPNIAVRLVSLLASADQGVAEVCTVIITGTTKNLHHAEVFNDAGAIPAIVHLLTHTLHDRCVEACINALTVLARHSAAVSCVLTTPPAIVPMIVPFIQAPIHSLRLAACRLLTIFHLSDHLPPALDVSVTSALVSLLTLCSSVQLPQTAQTLAQLVASSEPLQSVATKAGAVIKLSSLLVSQESPTSPNRKGFVEKLQPKERSKYDENMPDKSNSRAIVNGETIVAGDNPSPALRASVLSALAALGKDFDEARDAVISQNVLPVIMDGLTDKDTNIVQASVECLRSLSRSVKILRRDIARESVGSSILCLLSCKEREIQRCASATLCNLVLEFSPVRATIIDKGGATILLNLLSSEDDEVRKNCLWALKNLVFKADVLMKSAVLSSLKYDALRTLFADKEPIIRELAMTVVRNLACSASPEKHFEQLDALFAVTGERIISLLSEALKCDSTDIKMVEQALYVVCNIASGTEKHKAYLLESDIPQLILQWTSHENERARIAAVWCTINLSWKERDVLPTRQMRPVRASRTGARMDALRRQHLPLPASPQGRRILERYDTPVLGGSGGSSDDIADMWVEDTGSVGMEDVDMEGNDDANAGSGASASASENTSDDSSVIRHRRQPGETEEQQESQGHEVYGAGAEVDVGSNNDMNSSSNGKDHGDQNGNAKSCGYEWRIERLRHLGFERRLRTLVNDPHIEVQGRARAALELFNCEDVRPLDYDPSTLLDTGASLLPQGPARRAQSTSPVLIRGSSNNGSAS